MARGFLSGAMMGTVVSLGIAGVASIIDDGPAAPIISDAAPDDVRNDDDTLDQTEIAARTNDADLVQDSAAVVSQLVPDDVDGIADAGSDLSLQPETGGVGEMKTPDAGIVDGTLVVLPDTPVLPSPQAALPMTPAVEAELSISTDPAQPPAPQVSQEETAFAAPPSDTDTSEPAARLPDPVEEVPAEIDTALIVDPEQPQAPAITDQENALPQADESLLQGSSRPKIGRPAGSLIAVDSDPEAEEGESLVITSQSLSPLKAYAVPFEDASEKPLMAIVLIDAGVDLDAAAVGLPALRSFPAPITFAVDSSLPDAVERMKNYRAEGFEVMAMVDLPSGATALDAETTFDSVLSQMTEVVGVIEGVGTGIQEVREASDQATQILLASGHGFVTQSKGLNTVAKLAERIGVPTATVFRDFDSADQTPTVIRRFLDQAAFRAGQEGGVIMLGRLRPDTISALLLWGLADRASRVSLAPVSAILNR